MLEQYLTDTYVVLTEHDLITLRAFATGALSIKCSDVALLVKGVK